jgi:hypothetical protein
VLHGDLPLELARSFFAGARKGRDRVLEREYSTAHLKFNYFS